MSYVPSTFRRTGYHFQVSARDDFDRARQLYLARLRNLLRESRLTVAEATEEVAATASAALQLVRLELDPLPPSHKAPDSGATP